MNILILNHYAGSPEMGMEFRPYYLAKEWQKYGHKVVVVGGTFSHLRKKQPSEGEEMIDGVRFVWLKTPSYQGNGVKRVFSMLSFLRQTFWGIRKKLGDFRPAVVIASSTYPLDNISARKIARKFSAKHIYEIHDLWPLSPMELGCMSKFHPFIVMMQWAENYAYRKCDAVVSILPKVEEHCKSHGLKDGKLFLVPNGITMEDWEHAEEISGENKAFFSGLREKYRFVLGYLGGHALSNSLDILLDAAKMVSDENIAIVLVGNGVEKAHLMQRVENEGISNVFFQNPVSKRVVPKMLSEMDGLYIGWRKSSLYRFGISPNKLFDYAMSQKPIIHAVDAGNDMVADAKCGISVVPDDSKKIAQAIVDLSKMTEEERSALGNNGHDYVMKHHTYNVLAKQFLDVFLSLGVKKQS